MNSNEKDWETCLLIYGYVTAPKSEFNTVPPPGASLLSNKCFPSLFLSSSYMEMKHTIHLPPHSKQVSFLAFSHVTEMCIAQPRVGEK